MMNPAETWELYTKGKYDQRKGSLSSPWKQGCFCWYIWKKSGPIIHCDFAATPQAFSFFPQIYHYSPLCPKPAITDRAIPWRDGPHQRCLHHCQDGFQWKRASCLLTLRKKIPTRSKQHPVRLPVETVTCCFTQIGVGTPVLAPI